MLWLVRDENIDFDQCLFDHSLSLVRKIILEQMEKTKLGINEICSTDKEVLELLNFLISQSGDEHKKEKLRRASFLDPFNCSRIGLVFAGFRDLENLEEIAVCFYEQGN